MPDKRTEQGTELSVTESSRLAALYDQGILDTVPEVGFDDIVRLATRLCDTPVALISLVDRDRQWFKAKLGFEPCETPIAQSVCKHAIGLGDLLVIPDLTQDVRTSANPLVVGEPHMRFYAGAPLVTAEGQTLGTLCVIDHRPRPQGLTEAQADDLRAAARQVMALLDMRHLVASRDALLVQAGRLQEQATAEHQRLTSMFDQAPGFMALLKGPEHVFELANPAYCTLIGNRDLIGRTVADALPDAGQQGYVTLLDQVYRSGKPHSERAARYAMQVDPEASVEERFLDFVFQPVLDEQGRVTGIFIEGSDVTAHVRQSRRVSSLAALGEQLRDMSQADEIATAAARCLADTIGGTCVGFGKVDAEALTIDVPVDWCSNDGISVVGLHDFRSFGTYVDDLIRGEVVIVSDAATDPRTASQAMRLETVQTRAFLNVPIMVQGRLDTVIFLLNDRVRTWSTEDIELVRQVGDRAHMAIARARAEREQQILNEELSHRMKNTLSIVQAIASQTLRGVSERSAVDALTKRIGALSRAHDVLLKQRWSSADLEDVVRATLSTFEQAGRVTFDGPPLQIGPRATLSVSLLLHELGTNAIKYGALSAPGGSIAISWEVRAGSQDMAVHMSWEETGGPTVHEPTKAGFGSRLIDMGLIGTGGVELCYRETGLLARMTAPLSQLQQS